MSRSGGDFVDVREVGRAAEVDDLLSVQETGTFGPWLGDRRYCTIHS